MPVTFTTDLPNVDSLSLDASETETLGATLNDPLNNGEYRLELRDDDPEGNHPPYELETTIAHSEVTQHTIENILGGEQYSVRVRTQTDHVIGNWLAAEEITKLLASSDVTLANIAETSLDVQWTINNDFRGSHQIHRQRDAYEYSGEPADSGRLVGSVADDSASFADGSVAPGAGYSYQVRTLTQWQCADSEVTSADTGGIGLKQSPVPARGWYVEIDHPSETVLTPQILGDIQRRPRLNEPPRVEIPVPRNETWLSEALDNQPLRVWKDGEQLAIDTLVDREIAPDRVILYGTVTEGLEDRVQADVDVEPADDLARRLIEDNTDLVANVDDAAAALQEDVLMLEAADTASLEEALLQALPETAPITIENGEVTTLQTCWTMEAEDYVDNNDEGRLAAPRYSGLGPSSGNGDSRELLSSGQYLEWEITNDHVIPADAFGFAVRLEGTGNEDVPSLSVTVDGEEIADFNFSATNPSWTDRTGGLGWVGLPTDLETGTHTVRLEASSSGSDVVRIDVVASFDTRYGIDFDDTLTDGSDDGRYLDSPQTHPSSVDLEFGDAETIFAVVNGTADIVMDETGNEQALALSNDRGVSWTTAANSQSLEADFAEVGDSLRLRVTLSNHGQRDTATPRTGYQGQTLESLELRADIDDTPLVIDETFDGDLADVLATIAQDSESIWEVGRDAGELSIEWTQSGQRSGAGDLDVVDYTTRRVPPQLQRAIVRGSSREVRGETHQVTLGETIDLDEPEGEDILVTGSDRVRDVDGQEYERGTDYEIDRHAATITPTESGDLEDGVEYLVDYDDRIAGSFESDEFGGSPSEESVRDIAGLTTRRACSQAAKLLVDRGSEARTEADVSFPPTLPADLSLVEALDLEDVPSDAMAIYQLTEGPEGLEARFGDEERVRDTVEQLRRRAEALSRRV